MKKHPVDDFFKSKLSNLEKQPSSEAWSRIAREQKTKERKIAVWVWYAAASITVATMAGYLAWQGSADESQYLSMETGATKVNKTADSALPAFGDTADGKDSVTPALKVGEIAPLSDKNVANTKKVKAVNQEVIKSERSGLPIERVVESTKALEIAVTDIKKDDHSPEIIKSAVLPEIPKGNALQNTLASREPEIKEENRTIMVTVKTAENDSNEKSKTSRFTKVFRQLKNARAGDPVDWQEVGFNPKNIVAKVDERIRDKEEEISEKYQNIKQRTKL